MLLAWLILTKTVKAMRMYSRLLLHSCLMASFLKVFFLPYNLQDILIVIVSTLVQPIPIVDHGYRALFQNGVFRNLLPQPYAYMVIRTFEYLVYILKFKLNVLWIQLLLFFLASTTAQFIFRYFLLSKLYF
ncbi:unnamed protein product [Meloidogyne enterolobii]|uniref:Uncharacterized protein n=1 Tax=Meloidogyne enterolobii TaxID=390850 RepID=A0ACB1AFK0_MELEN